MPFVCIFVHSVRQRECTVLVDLPLIVGGRPFVFGLVLCPPLLIVVLDPVLQLGESCDELNCIPVPLGGSVVCRSRSRS